MVVVSNLVFNRALVRHCLVCESSRYEKMFTLQMFFMRYSYMYVCVRVCVFLHLCVGF